MIAYRRDIDGLRAIAVVAVILFHAGINGFGGGYVGVDVFFVISGFLITGILLKDHERGGISIVRFYERRARRILPALLALLFVTLAAGWLFLLPTAYADLGKSSAATVAFVSNIKFWRGSGYFESGTLPLLHTWSLAVEEQFYIMYPLFLGLVLTRARQWIRWIIALLFSGSLGLAIVGAYLYPSATFFLLPTRGWELLIGGSLALNLVPPLKGERARNIASWAGLFAILWPIALYTPYTVFPGLAAIPPCIGSALLIHAGGEENQSRFSPSRWLFRSPVVVFIGLISYSLYLYHFPIFAFAKLWFGPLGVIETLVCICGTFLCALISWRFVERPFRSSANFTRARIFILSASVSAAAAALSLLVVFAHGFEGRFNARTLQLAAGEKDFDPNSRKCINIPLENVAIATPCALGTAAEDRGFGDFILWGDSHAAALSPAIDQIARRANASGRLISFNACAPLLDFATPALSWKDQETCRQRNAAVVDKLANDPRIRTVILTGFWSAYVRPGNRAEDHRAFTAALNRTLDQLRGKRVVFLLDTPRSAGPLPAALALADHFGWSAPKINAGNLDGASTAIRAAANGRAQVIETWRTLCDENGQCQPTLAGRPILSDANHVAFSVTREVIAPWLEQQGMFARPPLSKSASPL